MSATSHGASAGIVLGIVAVVFGQQLGWFNLSDLLPAVEYLAIGIVVGGVLGAGIGYALGRRYTPKKSAPVAPWAPGNAAAPADGSTSSGGSPPTSPPAA